MNEERRAGMEDQLINALVRDGRVFTPLLTIDQRRLLVRLGGMLLGGEYGQMLAAEQEQVRSGRWAAPRQPVEREVLPGLWALEIGEGEEGAERSLTLSSFNRWYRFDHADAPMGVLMQFLGNHGIGGWLRVKAHTVLPPGFLYVTSMSSVSSDWRALLVRFDPPTAFAEQRDSTEMIGVALDGLVANGRAGQDGAVAPLLGGAEPDGGGSGAGSTGGAAGDVVAGDGPAAAEGGKAYGPRREGDAGRIWRRRWEPED